MTNSSLADAVAEYKTTSAALYEQIERAQQHLNDRLLLLVAEATDFDEVMEICKRAHKYTPARRASLLKMLELARTVEQAEKVYDTSHSRGTPLESVPALEKWVRMALQQIRQATNLEEARAAFCACPDTHTDHEKMGTEALQKCLGYCNSNRELKHFSDDFGVYMRVRNNQEWQSLIRARADALLGRQPVTA